MRSTALLLFTLLAGVPLAAQQHQHDPDDKVAGNHDFPAGWQVRLDHPDAGIENVIFQKMGDGFHVTVGPAVILYDPQIHGMGEFRAHASFAQQTQARHPEGYGLIAGGRALNGEGQDYVYFLIRQDGKFLVKHRAGSDTHTVQEWTASDAIRTATDGTATNQLAIEAGPQSARFLINGTEVASFKDVPYLNTDGIVGLRVNHNLDVHITDFGVEGADDAGTAARKK